MVRGSAALWLPLVCLLLGLGAGYLLFGDDGSRAPGKEPELTSDAMEGGRTPAPDPLRVATLEGRGKADPLVAALEAIPLPPAEVGTGVISGTVTTKAGEPLEGVRMTLTAAPDAGSYVRPDPKDDADTALLKRMRWMLENHRANSAYRQVTTTDSAGAYRFEQVTDRLHRIEGLREGYLIYSLDRSTYRGVSPGATVDFQAMAQARLRIEVTGSAAPTSLSVELRSGNGGMLGMQWSASSPVLDCQPGRYDLHVSGGANQELRAGPYPVELVAGAEPVTVRVELEARPVLRLHLAYAPDEVMPLYTYIMPTPSGGMPTSAALRASGKNDMRSWMHHSMLSPTAKEHIQTLTDLEEGPHVVGIARDRNGSIVHMEEVLVRGGIVDHTIQVPPLDPADYVIVGAYGPKGAPVRNAQFNTGYSSKSSSSSGGSQTALRRDGRVLVMHQAGGDAGDADAIWWIDVTAPTFGSKRVEYVRGQVRELRVDFQEPAEVAVEVKGVQGTPYEGRVSVAMHPGATRRRPGIASGTKPDAKGLFHVRGLQPGDYILTVSVQSGQHRTSPVAEVPYTVKSGSQQTSIALPPLFTLTVRGATRHVSLSSTDRTANRSHQSQMADEDGVVVFDALPAGSYRIRSGSGRAEVTLPGPSSVTLTKRSR